MTDTFKPDLSFTATVLWEGQDDTYHPLAAGVSGETPFKHDDGWIHAGEDHYTQYARNGAMLGRLISMNFWFGCYQRGDRSYAYDIRSLSTDRSNRFHRHQLDVSANGYLGLYGSPMREDIGVALYDYPLWRLEWIDSGNVLAGTRLAQVALVAPGGGKVKRVVENRYGYLSDRKGADANFALQIIQTGAGKPE